MAVKELNELRIYRGDDYPINDKITIHIPTLNEICDYGDDEYFSLVHLITATPSDMMWQLDDLGVDFTTIDNFTLFSEVNCFIPEGTPEENFQFNVDKTRIIFGDLNLYNFKLMRDLVSNEKCLYDASTDTKIDGYTFKLITDCLRKIHFLTEHIEMPANKSTKMVLIEDARERHFANKDKDSGSYLLNLISAMVNSEGFKYNHTQVWDMRINAFLDSVRRISKIKNAGLLLQSGYSGFGVNLKEISDKQLDWLGEL